MHARPPSLSCIFSTLSLSTFALHPLSRITGFDGDVYTRQRKRKTQCKDDAFRDTQQHVQDRTSLEHHPQRCICIRDATARSNHAHSSRHADSREQWSRVLRCSLSGIFTVAEAMRLLSALDDVQLCAHFCQNEFCYFVDMPSCCFVDMPSCCFVDMPSWMCVKVDSGRTATTGACM